MPNLNSGVHNSSVMVNDSYIATRGSVKSEDNISTSDDSSNKSVEGAEEVNNLFDADINANKNKESTEVNQDSYESKGFQLSARIFNKSRKVMPFFGKEKVEPKPQQESETVNKIIAEIKGFVADPIVKRFIGVKKLTAEEQNKLNIGQEKPVKIKKRSNKTLGDKIFNRLFPQVNKEKPNKISESQILNDDYEEHGFISGIAEGAKNYIDYDPKKDKVLNLVAKIGLSFLNLGKLGYTTFVKLAAMPFEQGFMAVVHSALGASVVGMVVSMSIGGFIIAGVGAVLAAALIYCLLNAPDLAKKIAARSAATKSMTGWQKVAFFFLSILLVIHGVFIKKVELAKYYALSTASSVRESTAKNSNIITLTSPEFLKKIQNVDKVKKYANYALNAYAIYGFVGIALSLVFGVTLPLISVVVFSSIWAQVAYVFVVLINVLLFIKAHKFPNKYVKASNAIKKYADNNFKDMTLKDRTKLKAATLIKLEELCKVVTGRLWSDSELQELTIGNAKDLMKSSKNKREFYLKVRGFFEDNDAVMSVFLYPQLIRLATEVNKVHASELELLDDAIKKAANVSEISEGDEEKFMQELDKKTQRKEINLLFEAFLEFCAMVHSDEISMDKIGEKLLEETKFDRTELVAAFVGKEELFHNGRSHIAEGHNHEESRLYIPSKSISAILAQDY